MPVNYCPSHRTPYDEPEDERPVWVAFVEDRLRLSFRPQLFSGRGDQKRFTPRFNLSLLGVMNIQAQWTQYSKTVSVTVMEKSFHLQNEFAEMAWSMTWHREMSFLDDKPRSTVTLNWKPCPVHYRGEVTDPISGDPARDVNRLRVCLGRKDDYLSQSSGGAGSKDEDVFWMRLGDRELKAMLENSYDVALKMKDYLEAEDDRC